MIWRLPHDNLGSHHAEVAWLVSELGPIENLSDGLQHSLLLKDDLM